MCAQWRVEQRTIRVTTMGRMYEELPMGRKIMLSSLNGVWRPPTDVFESGDAYVIRIEISGLRVTAAGEIENAKLHVQDDMVILHGERSDDCPHAKCNYYQMEIQYGPFEVAVPIPPSFDSKGITTRYSAGFLEVVVPKAKPHRALRAPTRTRKRS
jgi:HSP20 family molecular chaperone IbpA